MLIAYVQEKEIYASPSLDSLIRALMRKNAGDRYLLSYFRALQVSQGNVPN